MATTMNIATSLPHHAMLLDRNLYTSPPRSVVNARLFLWLARAHRGHRFENCPSRWPLDPNRHICDPRGAKNIPNRSAKQRDQLRPILTVSRPLLPAPIALNHPQSVSVPMPSMIGPLHHSIPLRIRTSLSPSHTLPLAPDMSQSQSRSPPSSQSLNLA